MTYTHEKYPFELRKKSMQDKIKKAATVLCFTALEKMSEEEIRDLILEAFLENFQMANGLYDDSQLIARIADIYQNKEEEIAFLKNTGFSQDDIKWLGY